MVNVKIKEPRLAIAVIAVAAIMLVAATEMAITGYAFAAVICDPPAQYAGQTVTIDFSAQSDGTVSGTYTFSASGGFTRSGTLTDGTIDGSTYSLSGVNQSICRGASGSTVVDEITLSGDCGDGVTVTYEDRFTDATFVGDIACPFLGP